MRILVGHTNQMPQLREHLPLPNRHGSNDQILAFGNGYQQVQHYPGMPWQQLLANCPPGWKPDLYIHWSPEYNAVPQGLEHADCLTVGVFGDWNLGGHALRSIAGIFDVLAADRAGGALLRAAGHEKVLYSRLWAFDPELHRRLPTVGRDIDILMIGNFNHSIHAGRSRFLARVARLSTRYNVVLTCGVHGEEYARMMNRAKIVFNHSVGGGINMRAYEAPACGALLFNEAANLEIRDIFTHGIDCVLYDEDNLESLLDHYLAPEHAHERERIAQAGWERVQRETHANHFAGLLQQLEPLAAEFATDRAGVRARRPILSLPLYEQTICLAAHWLRTSDLAFFPQLEALLAWGDQTSGLRGEVDRANLHAILLGKWAEASPSPARENLYANAIAHAQRAVALDPDYVMGYCNLAYLCFAVQQIPLGEGALQRALRMLDSPTIRPEQLRGDHYPHISNYFHVESERIWGRYTPESPEWRDAMRAAMRCRIGMTLAEIAYGCKDYIRAQQLSQAAIEAAPAVAKAHYHLGNACRALGQRKAAAEAFRRTIELSPFLLEGWLNLGQLYLEMNRVANALTLVEDLNAILNGCPIYTHAREVYDRLRDEVREQATNRLQAADTRHGKRDGGKGKRVPPSERLNTQHPTPAPPLRLLALPDWNDPESWQPLLRAYVEHYRPEDAIALLLPIEPQIHPRIEPVVADITRFLDQCLHTTVDEIPNVVLLTERLDGPERWSRLPQADALVLLQMRSSADYPKPSGLRTLTLDQLGQAVLLLGSTMRSA